MLLIKCERPTKNSMYVKHTHTYTIENFKKPVHMVPVALQYLMKIDWLLKTEIYYVK